MKEILERLVGIVPEIISLQVGINEKESDMAYDAVLISTFGDSVSKSVYILSFFIIANLFIFNKIILILKNYK